MNGGVRMLCVCTHNRTRSVMMGALFAARAHQDGLALDPRTGGFKEAGRPPTQGALDMLERHRIDASGHRSTVVSAESALAADLVLTTEQDHVISIATLGPGLFAKTFTLPEFVSLARVHGPRSGVPLEEWLNELGDERPRGIDYLSADVAEIADPTGQSPVEWQRCFNELSGLVDSTLTLLF